MGMLSRLQGEGGFDRRWLALTVTSIGSFMSLLDSTIVNIALPSILRDFHADLDNGQLVLTVYLLSLAIVIPISGFLAERVGMKRLYMITLVFFTIGSALCGLAWNLPSLIVFRMMQGLGGGMLQPLGMAIVFTMITPLERGRFMGMLGLPSLLAPVLGPTVGGYLVEYSSWRVIFLINVPIGMVNLWLAYRLLKETPIRREARLDIPGFVLGLFAFPGILIALSEGENWGWTSPMIVLMLGVGAVMLLAFILTEVRTPEPLLQLRLFRHPMFSLAMTINFVTQFSLFGLQFLLPLFLQTARGLSPIETGLVLLPSGLASFVTMVIGGRLYNRVGPRALAITGLIVLLTVTGLLSRMDEGTGVLVIAALFSFRGLAIGLCVMPVQTLAYNTVPQGQMTRATALTNVLFRIFGSASTAILTTVLVVSLTLHGAPSGSSITERTAPVRFMVEAFDDAFLVMTAITALGILLSIFLRDRVLERLRSGEGEAAGRHELAAVEG